MASTSTFDKPRPSLAGLLAAPFVAVGKFAILVAQANPMARKIERLNSISDAELAGRGLTRDGEIRRILGAAAAI